jgi:hypothetical protein
MPRRHSRPNIDYVQTLHPPLLNFLFGKALLPSRSVLETSSGEKRKISRDDLAAAGWEFECIQVWSAIITQLWRNEPAENLRENSKFDLTGNGVRRGRRP